MHHIYIYTYIHIHIKDKKTPNSTEKIIFFLGMSVNPKLLQQRMIGNIGPRTFRRHVLRKTALKLNECDGLCFHYTHDLREFYQLTMSSKSHDITETVMESDLIHPLLDTMEDTLTNINLKESFITVATVIAPSLLMLVDKCLPSTDFHILYLLCDITKHIEEIWRLYENEYMILHQTQGVNLYFKQIIPNA